MEKAVKEYEDYHNASSMHDLDVYDNPEARKLLIKSLDARANARRRAKDAREKLIDDGIIERSRGHVNPHEGTYKYIRHNLKEAQDRSKDPLYRMILKHGVLQKLLQRSRQL